MPLRINLGGEGEIADVLNQQGRWVVHRGWHSSADGLTLQALVRSGHSFLIADNVDLPLPNDAYDEVITNNTPPEDWVTMLRTDRANKRDSAYPEKSGDGGYTMDQSNGSNPNLRFSISLRRLPLVQDSIPATLSGPAANFRHSSSGDRSGYGIRKCPSPA